MNAGTNFGANVGVALARLIERGLVDGYSGLLAQGRGYRYSLRTRI